MTDVTDGEFPSRDKINSYVIYRMCPHIPHPRGLSSWLGSVEHRHTLQVSRGTPLATAVFVTLFIVITRVFLLHHILYFYHYKKEDQDNKREHRRTAGSDEAAVPGMATPHHKDQRCRLRAFPFWSNIIPENIFRSRFVQSTKWEIVVFVRLSSEIDLDIGWDAEKDMFVCCIISRERK